MTAASADRSEGLSLLIVEDEPLLAMMLEDMLASLGHRVAGSCSTLEDATDAVASGGFDAAFLDLDLRGKSGLPLASRLRSMAIPFAVASGYQSHVTADGALDDALFLAKPYAFADLEAVLDALKTRVARSPSAPI